jgi:choline dehydrogenase-like flavoprotein
MVCPVLGFPRIPVHGKPADGFEFEFLQFPPGDQPETLETDVVIIGSGCGGAVAAKNLAEAGHRVLVVEKSYHYPSKYFPMTQTHGPIHLFESGGTLVSDDGCMAVLAGSTWGGGGTINWSASLQTQSYVREEWAQSGLPFFTSSEFQKSLDRVCERMGVNTESIKHNTGNQHILEGSRKLGYLANTVPQNTANRDHYCGYCTLGCHSTTKQGPVATWLVDAANAGATFVEGFNVDRILFDTVDDKEVASGVQGVWTSRDSHLGTTGKDAVKRKVVIKAKRVIVSCGSLQSPLLLLRSGIKNPHIGRHLHLHPGKFVSIIVPAPVLLTVVVTVLMAAAVFDEDIRPWEGACLTTVVNQFEDLDGQGHGTKIEACSMMPSVFLATLPWKDGFQYKMFVSKFRHMTSFITLTRERDAGRVYPDPVDGRLRVDYRVSPFDRNHIVEGLIGCAKIAYLSGAKEFHTTYGDMPPFIRSDAVEGNDPEADDEGVNNAALQAWIQEFRRKAPLNPERGVFASAHQMGTCRMGSSPKKSVVAPDGQVWGTQGLYVVDASVFPSASGVNPMVTNMAISDWTSRNIARGLNREKLSKNGTARL